MYVFAEPMTEDQVIEVQTLNQAAIDAFEKKMAGRASGEGSDHDVENNKSWEDIEASVQNTMQQDELGLEEDASDHTIEPTEAELFAAPEANQSEASASDHTSDLGISDVHESSKEDEINDSKAEPASATSDAVKSLAPAGSILLQEDQGTSDARIERTSDATEDQGNISHDLESSPPPQDQNGSSNAEDEGVTDHSLAWASEQRKDFPTQADTPFIEEMNTRPEAPKTILAMTLTLRNKVNGAFVLRPADLKPSDNWDVEYSLVDVPDDNRAWALYQACMKRREKKLSAMPEEDAENVSYYIQKLRTLSAQGRKWRQQLDEDDKTRPVQVLGRDVETNG